MHMPPVAAWSIFILLGGLFVLIATNNAVLWWREFVLKQERTPSVVPLIGGILGYVGLRASPAEVISNYAWLRCCSMSGAVLTCSWDLPFLEGEKGDKSNY